MKPTKRKLKAELELKIAINGELQRRLAETEQLLTLLESVNQSNVRERNG